MAGESSKKLFYTAIALNKNIICENEIISNQPKTLALIILENVASDEDKKMSFTHEDLGVHYITKSNGLTYIIVCHGSINRRVPFLFLLNLEENFEKLYEIREGVDIEIPGSVGKDYLPTLKKLTDNAEKGENNNIGLANSELEQVKNIMIENVERVLERGDRINLLVSKTDKMNSNAVAFRKRSSNLQRTMWWQNVKYTVLLIVVGGLVIYLLGGLVCGFPAYGHCLL